MSRFTISDLKSVNTTITNGVIEWCAIDSKGAVHWLSEAEHATVITQFKAKGNGQFRNRADEELQAQADQLAAYEQVLREANQKAQADAGKIGELSGLLEQASQALTEKKVRAQLAEAEV